MRLHFHLPGILALVLLLSLAGELMAEFNFHYPRTRLFTDTAFFDGSSGRTRFGSGRSGYETNVQDAFDLDSMRAGVGASYTSDYLWREFKMSDSRANFAYEGYFSLRGLELSVFSVSDYSGDYDHGPPLVTDYRAAYSRKIGFSLNTISYTFSDWSNSASRVNRFGSGLDPAVAFPHTTKELTIQSLFFNDLIQRDGMNFILGGEANIRLDEGGGRTQAYAGVFANGKNVSVVHPNGARILASAIYHSDYYRDDSGVVGSNFFVDMAWDFRELNTAAIFTISMEYFLPWNDATYQERFLVRARIELPFY